MPAPADYIDVAERIEQFYLDYPDGRLTAKHQPYVETIGDKTWIVYTAQAYRTPDDPCPCEGTAWEPVPGKTNFTRDSELMNAETSAWGRAIVAVGYASKGKPIASANEVRNRQGNDSSTPQRRRSSKPPKSPATARDGIPPERLAALKELASGVPAKKVGEVLKGLDCTLGTTLAASLAMLTPEQADKFEAAIGGGLLPANAEPLEGEQ